MDAPGRHGCPDAPVLAGGPTILRVGTLGAMVGSALAVLRDAVRLLLGQWPTLAAIALLGLIGDNGFLLVLRAGRAEANGLADGDPAALVPISSLVALVLMLRHAGRHDRRWPGWSTTSRLAPPGQADPPGEHPHPLPHATSPRTGSRRTSRPSSTRRWPTVPHGELLDPDIDTNRGLLVTGGYLFGLVAVAFVLRTALDRRPAGAAPVHGACSPPTSKCSGSSCSRTRWPTTRAGSRDWVSAAAEHVGPRALAGGHQLLRPLTEPGGPSDGRPPSRRQRRPDDRAAHRLAHRRRRRPA